MHLMGFQKTLVNPNIKVAYIIMDIIIKIIIYILGLKIYLLTFIIILDMDFKKEIIK